MRGCLVSLVILILIAAGGTTALALILVLSVIAMFIAAIAYGIRGVP